jgi:hypothetical protein
MPSLNLCIAFKKPIQNMSQASGPTLLRYLAKFVEGAASGKMPATYAVATVENGEALATGFPAQAGARLIFASSSGDVGAEIAGTAVLVTWATSDTLSMTALCTAIRANASVNRVVTATDLTMRATVGVVTAGQQFKLGNALFTAVNGAAANFGTFDMSSGTAATIAANIAQAINRNPGTQGRYVAVSSGATLEVALSTERPVGPNDVLRSYAGSTLVVTKLTPARDGVGVIIATTPGQIGNEVRAVASGTNVTIATNGTSGQLGGGQGGGSAPYFTLG